MSSTDDKKLNKKRIWELDALRGLFIIVVVFVHVMFDLDMFGFVDLYSWPSWYHFMQEYGGILFILISGICITLGTHFIKRGIIVAIAAIIVTIATLIIGDPMNYIFFGILHLIALCMLTYPLFKHLPTAIILLIGIAIAVIGFWFESFYVESENLFWIGLINKDFAAGDFFPVFPNLGFFLIGISIGRTLYKNKESLLPNFPHDNLIINSLSWLGRNSLFVYLGHQPIAYVICLLLYNIKT